FRSCAVWIPPGTRTPRLNGQVPRCRTAFLRARTVVLFTALRLARSCLGMDPARDPGHGASVCCRPEAQVYFAPRHDRETAEKGHGRARAARSTFAVVL